MTFKDIFPGHSRTLSFNFQDFPGPGILRKNPGLSRRLEDLARVPSR